MTDETDLTPSQRIIKDAVAPKILIDATGKKLTIRKLTALDQLKLYRAIGSEHCDNQRVYWMSAAAAGVSHINGVFMPFPKNQDQIDDRMKRIGDEGLAVIMQDQAAEVKVIMDAAKALNEARELAAATKEAAIAAGEEYEEVPDGPDPLEQSAGS
jgi:hypothetical protein